MAKKVLTLSLALAMLVLCVAPVLAETGNPSYTIMYVYTDNGKNLNVRSSPYVGENIIGQARFGESLKVKRFLENGWACIIWNLTGEAYVQSRYLQWNRPGSYTPATATPAPTAAPTVAPYINNPGSSYSNYANTYTDTLAVLNAEFRTARTVTPFVIVVRPSRASGWVNMRWAPSKDTEVITTYRSGARLTVIAETQSWYQVVDHDTEITGFMMKAYTTRQN
ncbi:MAG: SH3 domain-containing protein [Clostridia bacterium]|nr:SH3 domain-containing protein [Clostridia bacterium]